MLIMSWLLGPKRPSEVKLQIFETGNPPIGTLRGQRFPVKFYLVAILFIVFDIEVVFMYPWAVAYRSLGLLGFVEMGIFVLVLTLGLVFVWRKGALEWD
jgi:NADH-quinone oxidoreductase subunit A